MALRNALLAMSLSVFFAAPLRAAELKLSGMFTENMVLQRDREVPIWGWADPGEKLTVKIAEKEYPATADDKGRWKVMVGPFPAGGPHEMYVTGQKTLRVKNILFGEVWVCSGQSNMEWSLGAAHDAATEIPAANFPKLRLFTVPKTIKPEAQEDVKAVGNTWLECSPIQAKWFSAVGFFFGKHLHQKLDVPIGLIHTSWGGTPAQSWVSGPSLSEMAAFKPAVDNIAQTKDKLPEMQKKFEEDIAVWEKEYPRLDAGSREGETPWSDPALDTKDWKEMKLPGFWENSGLANFDGVVWFRREVEIPADWADKKLVLTLGAIDDTDSTYLNGVKVGGIDTAGSRTPRKYVIPADKFKPGKSILTVRVSDLGREGGFSGKPDDMKLAVEGSDAAAVALAGPWVYKVGADLSKMPKPVPPAMTSNPHTPTVLYNGMIAPVVPYAIRGAIWYQGESNAGAAFQYRTLLPTLIKDWRKQWGTDLTFLIVQLANFKAVNPEPGNSQWAELREAQLMTALQPNNGLAVAIDIGDAKDIHPRNKHTVGDRLGLAARAIAYGEKIVYSGPIYKSMEAADKTIKLKFDHVGGGLIAKGGEVLKGFAIAGEDQKFVWADAKIDGDTVIVSSDKVEKPAAVRYAWADNPEGCNLYNKEDLPASPFRTDDWPGVTQPKK